MMAEKKKTQTVEEMCFYYDSGIIWQIFTLFAAASLEAVLYRNRRVVHGKN